MDKKKTEKVARLGLLTALALIAGYVELLVPLPVGIPGVKLGLANLVVVWALYALDAKQAFAVNAIRILLSGFMFSSLSMILYSLAGALLSFGCMYLAKRSGAFSLAGVSVIGGVAHNVGQLIVAMFVVESLNLLYYGPVLLLTGLLTGFLIGIAAYEVYRRLPGPKD